MSKIPDSFAAENTALQTWFPALMEMRFKKISTWVGKRRMSEILKCCFVESFQYKIYQSCLSAFLLLQAKVGGPSFEVTEPPRTPYIMVAGLGQLDFHLVSQCVGVCCAIFGCIVQCQSCTQHFGTRTRNKVLKVLKCLNETDKNKKQSLKCLKSLNETHKNKKPVQN